MRGLLGPSAVRVLGVGEGELGAVSAVQDAVNGTGQGDLRSVRKRRKGGHAGSRGKDGAHAAPPLSLALPACGLALPGMENVRRKAKKEYLFFDK